MARQVDFRAIIKTNYREPKPRTTGITEIRGPYYSVMGTNYLQDVLHTMSPWIDSLKFAGGSFAVIQPAALRDIIQMAHEYDVQVSTGGFMEYVLAQGKNGVKKYIQACAQAGFDIVELSAGSISLSTDDWLRLIEMVEAAGMKAKPGVSIQFGAGGDTDPEQLAASGYGDVSQAIRQAEKFLQAGASMIMIESEGITGNVHPWRNDVVTAFTEALGMQHLMFAAADPPVFEWYIKNYGHRVNLFVDHSQVVQLECLRQGIRGTQQTRGRIQGLD